MNEHDKREKEIRKLMFLKGEIIKEQKRQLVELRKELEILNNTNGYKDKKKVKR